MKGNLDCPVDFELYDGIILWDDHREILEHVKDAIYMKPLMAYLALDHSSFCSVYWNDYIGYWCGDLWTVEEGYVITYICDSPEEIRDEIIADYREKFED